MKPVIHSEKHIIQSTLRTITAGAIEVLTLAEAVDVPSTSNVHVSVGAVIKAINVENWVKTNDTSAGSTVIAIIKLPGGKNVPSAAEMANLNDYSNKNNVFYLSQGLTNVGTADAIMNGPGLVLIPKGKQRMALGDEWVQVVFAQALDQNICGKTIYKEYL